MTFCVWGCLLPLSLNRPNNMSNGLLQANDVSLNFGDIQAIKHISLDIAAGQLTALVGSDGAGKTSLIRMVTGLLTPTSGHIQVFGMDVVQNAQAIQNRISYMPQRFGLYEDLTVQENFDLYADLHGVAQNVRRERYERLMHMADMLRFGNRPAGQLSGGMKQKLGLACTLVRSPELLVLDEPTVGVDPLSRRELWRIVQQLVTDEHLSVLLATTYLDEAAQCAQVYVMHEGQILAQGTPEALRNHAKDLCYTVAVPQSVSSRSVQARLLDQKASIIDAVPQGGAVRVIRQPEVSEAQLRELTHGAPLTMVDAALEDGFLVILQNHAKTTQTQSATAAPAATQTPASSEIMIEVKDLVRKFGDFTAVANISFDVKRGEIFGLLGPNGAGKTTTFRMLCGLLPASSGFLQVAGVNLRKARAAARTKVGYVSQKFALYGNLSVQENLVFFGQAYGLFGKKLNQRIETVVAQFELAAYLNAQSGLLPGGFKRRLAMAVGLLHEPNVLFLDEPTSGADPQARREFWRRITALADTGITIIITTHFMEEAEYCDRMVIQDAGRILALGTPTQVRSQTGVLYRNMDEAFIGIVEAARALQ